MFALENETIDAKRLPGLLGAIRDAARRGEEIKLRELKFEGPVDLSGLRATAAVRFLKCTFPAGASLERAQLEGGLFFTDGCDFHNTLTLADARITGPLDLEKATLRNANLAQLIADREKNLDKLGEEDEKQLANKKASQSALFAPRLVVDGPTSLAGVTATGRLFLLAADLRYDLSLKGANCDGQWYLHSARIGGQFRAGGAQVHVDPSQRAVNMEHAEVGGAVFFNNETKVTGSIDLRAKVGGAVNFMNATIEAAPNSMAVAMEAAEVGGAVFFRDETKVTGRIDLRAKVGSNVEFTNATIEAAPDSMAVTMEAAEVGGAVFFRDETKVTGRIDLRAKVGSNVEFTNATIEAAPDSKAVTMETAEVGGPVFLTDGAAFVGSINLSSAKLSTGLFATSDTGRVQFTKPGHYEDLPFTVTGDLWMDYTTVDGPVYLHGACIGGRVRMRHAKVAGDLDLCGGCAGRRDDQGNPDEQTKLVRIVRASTHLPARQLRTNWSDKHHDCTLRDEKPPEVRRGERRRPDFDLRMARIGGRLWVKGQRVLGDVDLEDARVEGEANFTNGTVHGRLRLRGATVIGRVFSDETTPGAGPYPQVTKEVDARGATLAELAIRVDPQNGEAQPERFRLGDVTARRVQLMWDFEQGGPELEVHNLKFDELVLGDDEQEQPEPEKVDIWRQGGWGRKLRTALLLKGRLLRALRLQMRGYACSGRDLARAGLWCGIWLAAVVVICFGLVTPHAWWTALPVAVLYFVVSAWSTWQSWLPVGTKGRQLKAFLAHTKFSPAFYVTVENWLRSTGKDPVADDVFLLHRRRELEDGPDDEETDAPKGQKTRPRFGLAAKAWRWCGMDFLLGYGVRRARMVHAFLLVLLMSWGVFLQRESVQRPLTFPATPSSNYEWNKSIARNRSGDNPYHNSGVGPGPEEWTAGQAFFMGLRCSVPLIDLFAESDWAPSSDWIEIGGVRIIEYENYAAAAQTANLVIIPLAIAGLTGFLKRKQ